MSTVVVDAVNAVSLPGSGGGGGGAVTSVNGKVGVVVLAASDVGADPTGSATTAQTNAEAYTDTKIATAVLLTGNQTVAGVKTFSSSPIVPDPTTSLQAVNLEYLDANAVLLTAYSAFADMASLGTNVTLGTPHLQSRTEPGSVVRLLGQLTFSGTATGTLFTMPVGQRPAATVGFQARSVGTGAVQFTFVINTDGTVVTGASLLSTVTVNFDGLTFVHA